ncbi:MAG: hypothetical protein H0X29_04035 [Parachlamydiaceae bacterium]|nr:hypothetical protein [Parachlamydiaceae bacterium]
MSVNITIPHVPYDANGVFGAAVTLLFQPPYEKEALKQVAKGLKKNYENMSSEHIKPAHCSEFSPYLLDRIARNKPVTPKKIMETGFCEQMQCKQLSPLHDRVTKILVPAMLNQVKPFIPAIGNQYPEQDEINNWLAKFVESYLSEKQLTDHCDFQEVLGKNPAITNTRNQIGRIIYDLVQKKAFNSNDLNALLKGIEDPKSDYLKDADNKEEVKNLLKRYQDLFAMAGDYSQMLSDMISSSLDTTFRSKFFSPINEEKKA